jgi:predicted glycosyltransferase
MRIWIDLSNSPHPLLFAPIARRLEELGHEIGVTVRDNAQTVELALQRWPDAAVIGGQSPKSRAHKVEVLMARIPVLRRWARSFRADLALSHNSYAQIVAARVLRLPVVTAMDYEGQPANHLAFRLADVIVMPEALRNSATAKQGANDGRTRFYQGFKEEIYLGDFEPDPSVLDSLDIEPNGPPVVVARTPPSRATYHQFGNPLFFDALDVLANRTNARTVVLVRHHEQRRVINALGITNLVVPPHAIDSRSLMYHADLVIGAGGTMTREAALMGVATYSVFAGEQSAVDGALEQTGRLRRLCSADQLLPLTSRRARPLPVADLRARSAALIDSFVDATLSPVRTTKPRSPAGVS